MTNVSSVKSVSDKGDYHLELSGIGGTVTSWKYRDVDIFSPQKKVPLDGRLKSRGGMHACFPNFGAVDPKFGLPKHGPLRDREADECGSGIMLFRGRDLLGNSCSEECEIRTGVNFQTLGFTYTLAARLIGTTSKEVFVNPALHPYFRTPEGTSLVTVWDDEQVYIHQEKIDSVYKFANNNDNVAIKLYGLGTIKMSIGGNAWKQANVPRIVLWRDSLDYLCVEPICGHPSIYGAPPCLRLTEEWLDLKCEFEFIPEKF